MICYTFFHYGRSAIASGISFGDFPGDTEAMAHALELLRREKLSRVELCHNRREVGAVSSGEAVQALQSAQGRSQAAGG